MAQPSKYMQKGIFIMGTFKRNKATALLSAALLAVQALTFTPLVSAQTPDDELAELMMREDPERFRYAYITAMAQSSPDVDSVVHDSRFDDCIRLDVIDVSHHQGDIDWNAVAAYGIDEAIIRIGFRGYGEFGEVVEDKKFRQNLEGATAAGLQVGVYFYTQAISTEEAIEEADFVLNTLGEMQNCEVTCPVYLDIEDVEGDTGRLDAMMYTPDVHTELCRTFCSVIEAGGYQAGIYSNKHWLNNKLYAEDLAQDFDIWLANYTTQTNYTGTYQMWQYSKNGWVDGINMYVDRNVSYSRRADYVSDGLTIACIGEIANPVLIGDGTFTYYTSDPNVATVDYDGTITAWDIGDARITAVSSNGTSDSIEITVGKSTHVDLGFDTMLFTDLGEQVLPELDIPTEYALTSSDPDVFTIDQNGNIETTGYGDAELILQDMFGNSITCKVVVPAMAPNVGDCNLDGIVNAGDATDILVLSADHGSGNNSIHLTDAHLALYDYDGNGIVDSADAADLLCDSARAGAGA